MRGGNYLYLMNIESIMNSLILLIIIVIGVLLVIEIVKHYLTKSFLKYVIAILVLLFILLILSAYFDLGPFFSKDSTFSQTGQVIANGVEKSKDNFDVTQNPSILDTIKDIFNKGKETFIQALSN